METMAVFGVRRLILAVVSSHPTDGLPWMSLEKGVFDKTRALFASCFVADFDSSLC